MDMNSAVRDLLYVLLLIPQRSGFVDEEGNTTNTTNHTVTINEILAQHDNMVYGFCGLMIDVKDIREYIERYAND